MRAMSRLTPWAFAAAAIACGGLGACFETPKPACVFLCGDGDACPEGYSCSADDNRCHRVESGGGLATCDDILHDASVPIDGESIDGTAACATPLAPVDDGTVVARQALLISEIVPGEAIEVFNNTAADVDLGTVAYQLSSDGATVAVSAADVGAGVTVAAGGQAVLGWPSGFTGAVDSGGEVALYLDDSGFGSGANIMSFVCWGAAPTTSVKTLAEADGKWTTGACPDALTMGAIHRLPATDGRDAADFDVTAAPSPTTCD